jgi:hypothetical protein
MSAHHDVQSLELLLASGSKGLAQALETGDITPHLLKDTEKNASDLSIKGRQKKIKLPLQR